MTSIEVERVVAEALERGPTPLPPDAVTVGDPWPREAYEPEIARLRDALVTPYRQVFRLRETDDPQRRRVAGETQYWVVARTPEMFVWYDDTANEFGVGEPEADGFPASIGLRGDLIGAFCAW